MKRIRLGGLSSQLLSATPARPVASAAVASGCTRRTSRSVRTSRLVPAPLYSQIIRCQSTTASVESPDYDEALPHEERSSSPPPLPSPPPEAALRSAKLAALRARLSLSSKLPLQSLARALVDPSADANPRFNNANLAFTGATIVQYHTSEWLITQWPRLPMAILFAAMKSYAGVPSLYQIARAWGVEAAAAPGEEVDPGLLQFAADKPTVQINKWGYVRAESKELARYKWRRGMSSRVLYDDAFGELVPGGVPGGPESADKLEVDGAKNARDKEVLIDDVAKAAHANLVNAVVGAVYLHAGREAAKAFVRAHVLSRRLDLNHLFAFKLPTRELARLCAREGFEPPVARLLSETGRLSRTPVFVVGIFSGRDKLGEATGASLDAARTAASINALKAWYLYSPGPQVGVPSDTFAEDAVPWKPAYVDIGEIIS
ncbi:ribonuclease III [Whalleya microplaca]|nr:ribonuclease III [Whalleya microplaca]